MTFDYAEFTTRNIGFVSEAEQGRLREATILVAGTGGMGGAAIQSLIRAGVGGLILADLDSFEVSNLNRQVFATLDSIDADKAQATRDACLRINPEARIVVHSADWTDKAADLIRMADVVINGTDDLAASLLLYRTARAEGRTVVDAYAAPLPSVYVTRPGRLMPEERLRYPTRQTAWNRLTDDQRRDAILREIEYVMLQSTSRNHIDLGVAADVAGGKRPRISFAPMVINTGTLMAYEALATILGRGSVTDERGWFLNPHTARIERPWPAPVAALLAPLARRALKRMIG